jgi:hypothetical protein
LFDPGFSGFDPGFPGFDPGFTGFDPGFLHSLLRGSRNNDCVSKIKSQDVRCPFQSKKQ